MSKDKVAIIIEDEENIDEIIDDEIISYCIYVYNRTYGYPEDYIPEDIVLGKVYKNKNTYSTQIRFDKDGIIARCKYYLHKGYYTFDFFKINHSRRMYRKIEGGATFLVYEGMEED